MSVLLAAPYHLPGLDVISVTVEAYNLIGYSTPPTSNSAGAVIMTAPLAPLVAPARVDGGTTDTQIKVSYANLVSPVNGGSTILSLEL